MNEPDMIHQNSPTRFSRLRSLTALLGVIVANAMTVSLLLGVILNGRALYRAEMRSLEVLLTSLQSPVEAGILLAAWVPIVICVVAFAIVIAGVTIIIWTNWVQRALAEINRLSILCPTLPWWKRGWCYSWLASAVGGLTLALGLFFTAAAVVMINVLVVIIALIG